MDLIYLDNILWRTRVNRILHMNIAEQTLFCSEPSGLKPVRFEQGFLTKKPYVVV